MIASSNQCEKVSIDHEKDKKNPPRLSFNCSFCSHQFKRANRLEQHEKKHIPPGGFICTFCDARFCYEIDRARHRETHKSFRKCLICELKFQSNELYLEHINDLHDGKTGEILECQQCCTIFRTSLLFKQHIETNCGKIKKFQCDICESKFINQNTLNAHKMIHAEKKQHLCDYCGNSFLSKGQLEVHKRSHTGEKPFKCEPCGKSFSYRESLVTHSSIHTGIKPYFCDVCNKQFSCIGNLIKHRRTRPETCGQPQYVNKMTKIAPRASAKNRKNLLANLLQTKMEIPQLVLSKSTTLPQPLMPTAASSPMSLSPSPPPQTPQPMPSIQENFVESNLLNENEYHSDNIESNKINDAHESIIDIQIKCLRNENDYDDNVDEVDEGDEGEGVDYDEKSQEQIQNDVITGNNDDNDDISEYIEIKIIEENQENYADHETYDMETIIWQNNDDDGVSELINSNINEVSDLGMKMEFVENEEKIQLSDKITILVNNFTISNGKTIILPIETSEQTIEYLSPALSTQPSLPSLPLAPQPVQTIYKVCEKIIPINLNHQTDNNHQEHQLLTDNILIKTLVMCPKCGKKFYSKLALTDHENSNCGKSPQYQCPTCQKLYQSAGSLKTHLTIHTGELPFKCQFCGKQFRTHGQVKVHERQHNGDKPFTCEYCDKSFAYRESILTHLSLHTGIKRFICNGCGNRFSCISNLQAHRKSHKKTCGQLVLSSKITKVNQKIK